MLLLALPCYLVQLTESDRVCVVRGGASVAGRSSPLFHGSPVFLVGLKWTVRANHVRLVLKNHSCDLVCGLAAGARRVTCLAFGRCGCLNRVHTG